MTQTEALDNFDEFLGRLSDRLATDGISIIHTHRILEELIVCLRTITTLLREQETINCKDTADTVDTVDTSGTRKYAIEARKRSENGIRTTLEDWHENWHEDSKYI